MAVRPVNWAMAAIFLGVLVGGVGCASSSGGSAAHPVFSIQELMAYCERKGYCGELLCCEGTTVTVRGYLDYINIVHRGISFNAGRSKFRLIDGPNIETSPNPWNTYTHSIDVYPVGGAIDGLFQKLSSQRSLPLRIVFVRGVIRGVQAYREHGVSRLITLEARAEDVHIH